MSQRLDDGGQDGGGGNLDPLISRKRFLQGAAGVGIALGAGGLLAACGGDDDGGSSEAAGTTTTAAGDIKRGGVLRVGHVGARQGRVVQPGPRRRLDRHVAPVPDLRPAHARRARPDAVAGPRARVEPERRRDGLRGQAPARRRLPQRQVVHRRRRHLHAPADGRREAPRPLRGHEHQPRRAQEARRPDGADPAEEPDLRPGGRVRERHHGDGAGRRDRLHQPGRHGAVQVRHVHARRAQPLAREQGLLGGGQAVRRRVGGHLDRRRGRPAERAALGRDRRDEPARLPAGEGPHGVGRHLRRERAEPVDALLLHGGRHRALRQPEGARGVPADPRPAGADRRRDLRLRHARQRPLRQGLQVLRRGHAGRARPTPRRRRRCSRRPATRTSRSRSTPPTRCPASSSRPRSSRSRRRPRA